MVIYKKPFSIETRYNDFILFLIYKKIPQLYPKIFSYFDIWGLLIDSLLCERISSLLPAKSKLPGIVPYTLHDLSHLKLEPVSQERPPNTDSHTSVPSPTQCCVTLCLPKRFPQPETHSTLLSRWLNVTSSCSVPSLILLRTSSSLLFTAATHPLSLTCYRLLMSVSYSILWNRHRS